MTRKESADKASADKAAVVVIVIVIVAEIEEGVAVVAVDGEVSSCQDLEAHARMPPELGRADVQIRGAVERFDFAPIPPGASQQEGSKPAAAPEEERRL